MEYVLTPKRTQLMEARIAGDEPTFTVDVPANDAELLAIVGADESGAPKLTFAGLAQEAIATRIQAVISKLLAADAKTVKDEATGKVTFVPEQFVSDAEMLEIYRKATPEAYRLLIGERASGGGRQSKAAAVAAKEAELRAADIQIYRDMAADAAMRPLVITLARAKGYTELLAELGA